MNILAALKQEERKLEG